MGSYSYKFNFILFEENILQHEFRRASKLNASLRKLPNGG